MYNSDSPRLEKGDKGLNYSIWKTTETKDNFSWKKCLEIKVIKEIKVNSLVISCLFLDLNLNNRELTVVSK